MLKGIDRNALVRVGEVISYLDSDRFMDKREAAEYCGVSIRTLDGWKGLPRYRPSGKTLFRRSEIDAFMQANLRVLMVQEIKTVPYAPLSHPFVETTLPELFQWTTGALRLGRTAARFAGKAFATKF